MMNRKKYTLWTTLMLPGLVLQAQTAHRDTGSMLDLVTVSAARTPEKLQEVPRMVTVLTAKDIAASQAQSLGEFLSMQMGASVIGAVQNPGANQSLFLRGTGSNQTTIMLDGLRISDPSTPNGAIDLSELSLADIERIEIVQGGHSAMYGTGALGGLVNIITRKAAQTSGSTVNLTGSAFGPGRAMAVSANTQRRYKSAFITAQGQHFRSGGMNSTLPDPNGGFSLQEKDGFRKTDLSLRGGWNGKSTSAWVGWRHNNQQTDIDAGAFRDDENYRLRMKRHTLHGGAEWKINKNYSLNLTGGWSRLQRNSDNDSSLNGPGVYDGFIGRDVFNGTNTGTDLFIHGNHAEVQWTGGLSYYGESASVNSYAYSRPWSFESRTSYDTVGLNSRILAAYGMANFFSRHRFSLALSGRISRHNLFGHVWNGAVNPSLKLGRNSMLYGNLSSGFNTPSLYQMLAPERSFAGLRRGNPDLKPEQGTTAEIGFKHRARTWSIQAAVFHNNTNRVIQYVYAWKDKQPDSISFGDYNGDTYINNGRSVQNGIQVEGSVALPWKLQLSGNVSLLAGKQFLETGRENGMLYQAFESGVFMSRDSALNKLSRRASTANMMLTRTLGKTGAVSVRARSVSRKYDVSYDGNLGPFGALNYVHVQSYLLMDLMYRTQIGDNCTLGLSVQNLTNRTYMDIAGFTTRPRSFSINLSFKLP
ncbi:MAG: TonB-dependent receptor [Bacteroidetes bacterium]|nr:TonB-dependent receptor [Bacteroidota bacterium]